MQQPVQLLGHADCLNSAHNSSCMTGEQGGLGGTWLAASLIDMDETIALDLNGKLTLRLRLVREAVVTARTGWADRLGAGQFLKIVDPYGKQAGDFWAFNAAEPRMSTCPPCTRGSGSIGCARGPANRSTPITAGRSCSLCRTPAACMTC